MLFRHLFPEERRLILEFRERGIRIRDTKINKGKTNKGYAALWRGRDVIQGEIIDTLTVVMRTSGCQWSSVSNCSMCGYFMDSGEITPLVDQFSRVLEERRNERMLKIYTSGSFLDRNEVPEETQMEILSSAGNIFDRVLIESRPGFVTEDRLNTLMEVTDLEIAIGLESANDEVLMHSINKGFGFNDFERAAKVLNSLGIPLRTYLILKPLFMSEADAIRDTIASINAAEDYSETISINPMNIQNFTLAEHLYRRGEYNPPFLWSLLRVLKTESNARLISAPSGGGTRRGVHNCGKCDRLILRRIEEFSLTRNKTLLDLDCDCKEEWRDLLVLEDAVSSSLRMDRGHQI